MGSTKSKLKFLLFILLSNTVSPLGSPQAVGAKAMNEEFYSESAYLGRQNLVANQSWFRFRTSAFNSLTPFFQLGTEAMTEGFGATSLDPGSSFGYAAPGLQLRLGKLNLYGLSKFRSFYRRVNLDPATTGTLDFRTLLVYGDYLWSHLNSRLTDSKHLEAFLEPYVEALFTSADRNNFIADAYARAGIRWRATPKLNLDLFLEPYVGTDRVGHYYNNLVEIRPSVRFQYLSGGLSISLLGSFVETAYFKRASYEPNPYSQIHTGARFLVVVGGYF